MIPASRVPPFTDSALICPECGYVTNVPHFYELHRMVGPGKKHRRPTEEEKVEYFRALKEGRA